jgi:hypothetical protein
MMIRVAKTCRDIAATRVRGAALLLLMLPAAAAPENSGEEAATWEAFPVLFERNIFDSERSAARVEPAAVIVDEPAPPAEHFRLAGVLISDDTAMGFFEGSRPQYDTAVFLDESIADLRLIGVDTGQVVFLNGSVELALPVGAGLVKDDEGNWQVSEAPLLPEREAPAGDSAADRDAGSASGGDEKDGPASGLLEQLRRRREQELNNE